MTDSAGIDLVTLEVIKNALDSIADEMALTVMRSSYSGIVRDGLDYSTALCDSDGIMLAQGVTIPVHLGSFPSVMSHLIERYRGRIFPEDVFIVNDPYGSGGIHLPDIYVVKPIFVKDQLLAFACSIDHHTDVGGLAPGSGTINSTEIFQEGLRIPTLKLYEGGKPNETLFEMIKKNVRVPTLVLGDLRAQVSACVAAERAYPVLVQKYGSETLKRYQDELLAYTERVTRAEISAIPPGSYDFVDYIDGVGEDPEPIRFQVKITVKGSDLDVDFEGTSPQIKAGLNSPLQFTRSAVYAGVRCALSPDIPNNGGYFRPITVTAPLGSIVNPHDLAPCAVRGILGYRIVDAVLGALSKALPERIPADGEGGSSLIGIGGYQNRVPFIYVESMMGTWGGRPNRDGTDGGPHPAANQTNQPIEIIEAKLPLRIESYGFLPDTGGPGKYRGGLALFRVWRILAEDASLTIRSDKRRFLTYGLAGGKSGTPSTNIIERKNGETKTYPVLPMEVIQLKAGDLYRHVMPGGGGWGDPLERDPERVAEDILDEKLTAGYCAREYGVVIDPATGSLDGEATKALRGRMRAEGRRGAG